MCQKRWFLETKGRSERDGTISQLMVMALRGFVGSPDKRKGHTSSDVRVQQSEAFTSL
jgi:hypothetical protein